MTTETVYTTDDPAVADKIANDDRRYREWVEASEAWVSQWPHCRLATYRDHAYGAYWVAGVYGDPPDEELWRYDRKRSCWTPRRSLKAARELVAAIDALKLTGIGKLPGMPRSVMFGWNLCSHGIAEVDGRVYVEWGKPSVEAIEKADEFDPAIWRRVKLSEYYAAKEAAEVAA